MKKYLRVWAVVALLILGGRVAFSQFVDPGTQAQLGLLNTTQTASLTEATAQTSIYTKMLDLHKDIKEAKAKFKWAKELKMIIRMEKLFESMYCSIKTMNVFLNVSGDLGCFSNIKLDQALMSYQASMDFVSVAIGASALTMASEGRVNTLSEAMDRMDVAIHQIQSFNASQRLNINKMLLDLADTQNTKVLNINKTYN